MPQTSRLLPLGIAVVLTTTLLGGGVAAADLRGDEREARLAAARAAEQARQELAFRDGLRPLAERVYDQVQPLQNAFDAFDRPMPDDAAVRDDVMRSAGAGPVLVELRAELERLPAPASLAMDKQGLDGGLEVLAGAADALRLAADAPADDGNIVTAYEGARDQLTDGILRWTSGVRSLLDGTPLPGVPVQGAPPDGPMRAPLSKGSYLFEADRICSSADEALARLEEADDLETLVRVSGQEAALIRSTVERLSAVESPEADQARLADDVLAPLERFARQAAAVEALAGAVAGRDDAAADRALDDYAEGVLAQADLARGLDGYGATLCGFILEVDPELVAELEELRGGGDEGLRT